MRPRIVRQSHLFERDRQVEVRVRIERIEAERLASSRRGLRKASEIVVDVAEVEMRLEEIGLETNCALVKRLRLASSSRL